MLSKNCIFVLTNNKQFNKLLIEAVVICFQKIVSLFWRTTPIRLSVSEIMLWFAFKKLYLCSDEQLVRICRWHYGSCDLLSKNCIFVLTNNSAYLLLFFNYVVICFQKIVSLFWRTTFKRIFEFHRELWFAFKKLYLCSDEQLIPPPESAPLSCDLLSKNCIFVLTNNRRSHARFLVPVVICFQKIVSLFWRTTDVSHNVVLIVLWFAFKKLYLCSDEQRAG